MAQRASVFWSVALTSAIISSSLRAIENADLFMDTLPRDLYPTAIMIRQPLPQGHAMTLHAELIRSRSRTTARNREVMSAKRTERVVEMSLLFIENRHRVTAGVPHSAIILLLSHPRPSLGVPMHAHPHQCQYLSGTPMLRCNSHYPSLYMTHVKGGDDDAGDGGDPGGAARRGRIGARGLRDHRARRRLRRAVARMVRAVSRGARHRGASR